VSLQLGDTLIEILQFDYPGRPYAPNLSPYDNEFQHFALVVEDMDAAFSRLSSLTGWSAISSGGPQQLPQRSGSVTAFKFRDPDGHPLEFLCFPQVRTAERCRNLPGVRLFFGIDHSAVSCSNSASSIDFYQRMGLLVVAQSFNHGIEQARLDGIPSPQLDVIALAPSVATPHLELLCYRNRGTVRASSIQSNDIAATRLIFERDPALLSGESDRLIFDPDGHHLLVTSIVPGTLES
jgi:catechol 2,3-dioxygenase-like lactoylglutathione lyase family enzyme